jgi:sialate O-acetylesterase
MGALRVALALAFAQAAWAQSNIYALNFSNTHGDHMVLQRDVSALVWGFGTAFQPVALQLEAAALNLTLQGIVNSEGEWRIRLPPQPAGGPYNLTLSCAGTGEVAGMIDVLFGIVILAGGQSNMAIALGQANNASALIAEAAGRPDIRIFNPQYSAQNMSQAQFVVQYAINWTVASPLAVGGFSAVAYLTAARLYDFYGGAIPIGIINTAVGGTMIQLWLPDSHLGDCPLPWIPTPPWTLSCWWNGMTAPVAHGPTDIAFFLWDQGENNVGERAYYECAFPTLIASWREALGNLLAPFYFVQLPEYINNNGTDLAELREGQLAALALPNVFFACTADNGDPLGVDTSIHTLNKKLVGDRLASAVLATHFNESIPYLSPRYVSAINGGGTGLSATVTLNEGPFVWVAPEFGPSAFSNSSWCPHNQLVQDISCAWFSLLGSDGVWRNATDVAIASATTIVLSVPGAPAGITTVATSNGYGDWPVVNVYTSAGGLPGLPLVPWTPRNVTAGASAP